MSLAEWKELREQLAGKWPSSNLSISINDTLNQITKTVYSKENE